MTEHTRIADEKEGAHQAEEQSLQAALQEQESTAKSLDAQLTQEKQAHNKAAVERDAFAKGKKKSDEELASTRKQLEASEKARHSLQETLDTAQTECNRLQYENTKATKTLDKKMKAMAKEQRDFRLKHAKKPTADASVQTVPVASLPQPTPPPPESPKSGHVRPALKERATPSPVPPPPPPPVPRREKNKSKENKENKKNEENQPSPVFVVPAPRPPELKLQPVDVKPELEPVVVEV